jgi:hypothetical protein
MPNCKRCGKIFRDNCDLNRHLSKKTPCLQKVDKCIYCFTECTSHKHICKLKNDPIRLLEIKLNIKIEIPDNECECRFCNKEFSRIDSLHRHTITCKSRKEYLENLLKQNNKKIINNNTTTDNNINNTDKQSNVDPKINEEITNSIYLVKEREFILLKKEIYKIGKTKQPGLKRFKKYPNGSILLIQVRTTDCDIAEKDLLNIFKTKFKHCKEIGNEYFEGSSFDMENEIYNYTRKQKEDLIKRNIEAEDKTLFDVDTEQEDEDESDAETEDYSDTDSEAGDNEII